jgi:hypothetical protein
MRHDVVPNIGARRKMIRCPALDSARLLFPALFCTHGEDKARAAISARVHNNRISPDSIKLHAEFAEHRFASRAFHAMRIDQQADRRQKKKTPA